MIRQLKWRFIAVFMAVVTLVLVGALSFNYVTSVANFRQESENTLRRLSEQPLTRASHPWGEGTFFPYFMLDVYRSGAIEGAVDQYYELSNEELISVAAMVLSSSEDMGELEDRNLRYVRRETTTGWRIVCIDMSFETQMQRSLLRNSILASVFALAALFGICLLLAKWTVRPVERAWQRQQQFIADASHELKTPLTVILSSADMLQSRPGDQEGLQRWTENIRAEGERMHRLIEDMLILARSEEQQRVLQPVRVDLSDLAETSVLNFEPAAFEQGAVLESKIAPDCFVQGEPDKLRQLVAILLDNALKYREGDGPIRLILAREGGRWVLLRISNPAPPISQEQAQRLFDRFYRTDSSRGQRKGYGLGLAIAQDIVSAHGGKIGLECNDGQVIFSVRLAEAKEGRPQQKNEKKG